jgi:hypothetical protein
MLIGKLFLPLSSPGLAAIGAGALAVTKGTSNLIQVAAIVVGLLIVAIAGVFTIRSNVAKIWHEQAEAEKERNLSITAELAQALKDHASELAKVQLDHAHALALVQADANEQRELKHKAIAELAAANMRTDLTPALLLLQEILAAIQTGGGASTQPTLNPQ